MAKHQFKIRSLRVTRVADLTVLTGRIDLAQVELLEHRFALAIDGGATELVVDLDALEELGREGLRVLVETAEIMLLRAGRVTLAARNRLGDWSLLEVSPSKPETLLGLQPALDQALLEAGVSNRSTARAAA